MTRRPPLAVVAALTAVGALVLSGCGEQVPGGTVVDNGQQQEQGGGGAEGSGGGAVAQPEQAEDADDPIVIKIEDDEFRTNMAIYRKYDEAKGGPLALYAPTKSAEDLDGGKKMEFATGAIYWSPETGAQIVRGQILKTYLDNGGVQGNLGWPIGDETTEGDMVYSDFQRGRIKLQDMAIQVIEHAN